MASSARILKPVLRLPPLPTTGDLLRFYKLRALKQLSQNFLLDPRICSKLVRSAGKLAGCHVIEVGPGPGNLTRPILEQRASSVVVIEKDRRFLPCLQLISEACDHRLKVIQGDILQHSLEGVIPEDKGRPWEDFPPDIHLIGNLPFSISTPLIVRWMKMLSTRSGPFQYGRVRMTLTFQQEVANRITAPTIHPERCRLTVLTQGYCDVRQCFTIVGGSFVPAPDVDVGVVKFVPKIKPLFHQPFDLVERVLNTLFNTKKKTIRRNLKNLIPPEHWAEVIPKLLERAEIDPEESTFTLSVPKFSNIIDQYAILLEEIPGLNGYNYRAGWKVNKLRVLAGGNGEKDEVMAEQHSVG